MDQVLMTTTGDVDHAVAKLKMNLEFDKEYAYCAIFVLSHGHNDSGHEWISCGRDSQFQLKSTILSKLTLNDCPHMKGRPLIVVVRACRGGRANVTGQTEEFPLAGATASPLLPDSYVLYSMPEGFFDSFSATKGSMFMELFCKGVQEGKDIEQIAKDINKEEILRKVRDPRRGTSGSVLQSEAGPVRLIKKFKFY